MSLMEQTYSVLLVSSSKSVNSAFEGLLSPSVFSPVRRVSDISSAKRAFAERAFDIVIVNSPLLDDPGSRFAIDSCSSGGTVALLIVKTELFDEITGGVSPHGVFTLSKPTSGIMLQNAVSWLVSARERLRKTEKKTLTLEEKMDEIRIVNRAKWALIEKRAMDEPSAHRYIEKQAMDRCVTRRAVAEDILKELLGG